MTIAVFELPRIPQHLYHPGDTVDLGKFIREPGVDVFALPEGDHTITPPEWKNPLLRHVVTVLENGTGLYAGIPVDNGVGVVEINGSDIKSKKGASV